MAAGHLTLFEPGTRPTVELVADSAGNVATDNMLVEIAGETSEHTQVKQVETAGNAVATIATMPREYDPNATYAAGDVVGEATVLVRHAVDWMFPSDAYTATAGDKVVSDAGGTVRAVDMDGTAPDDTGDFVIGPVWTTLSRGQHTKDKIAVVRQR